MTPRERVARAMWHLAPDRVPVMCQLSLGHYFLHSDEPNASIWFDSPCFADTLEAFRRRYGFDGILLNMPGRPANWQDEIASRRTDEKGETIVWRRGLETWIPNDDCPHTFTTGGGPLPRADVETVDPEDPATYRIPGYVWNTFHAPDLWDIPAEADLADPNAWPDWHRRALTHARAAYPDVSVHAEVFSPFTHLLELFGYENALIALLDEPALCERLLERFARIVEAQIRSYAPCEPDAILISSAFAGAGFISRTMYRTYVLPFEKHCCGVIHEYGLPAYTHTCGAIGDRLDLMAETTTDGIDTLDPPPLGTVDLYKAKRDFGERLFFKGNLDSVNEMLKADDVTFERAVLERLAIGKPGSGFILSSACSVAPYVRPDRLRAMTGLAETFGGYTL